MIVVERWIRFDTVDAAARLEGLRGVVPINVDDAVLVESWSNDTWVTDEAVLRICWRGDRGRLDRERQVLSALPASLPHASVLSAGVWEDGTWIVLRRLPGKRLDLAWPTLPLDQRRRAVRQLGEILRSLHRWAPPPKTRALLSAGASVTNKSPAEIAGSMLVPWPLDRLSPLLEWSEGLLPGHPDLHRALRRRSRELAPVAPEAEFEGDVVVHGDAHAANVLYDRGELVALLDYEWARLGPADLELEAACRDDPQVEAGIDDRGVLATEVFGLTWLREGYPELFEREHLTERLWLYRLCFELRSLCVWADGGVSDRQLSRLRSIADHPWVRFS
jgi:aminoglycoside phosphotransferase (APT) family kinase protein